jgi:hypothetical protein
VNKYWEISIRNRLATAALIALLGMIADLRRPAAQPAQVEPTSREALAPTGLPSAVHEAQLAAQEASKSAEDRWKERIQAGQRAGELPNVLSWPGHHLCGVPIPYGQNKYRILGASDVSDRRIAAFFTKNRLILFERAAAADADYLIEQDNDRWRKGGGPKRHLTAVEFALPFTPRLESALGSKADTSWAIEAGVYGFGENSREVYESAQSRAILGLAQILEAAWVEHVGLRSKQYCFRRCMSCL